jgi:hypothetical protein
MIKTVRVSPCSREPTAAAFSTKEKALQGWSICGWCPSGPHLTLPARYPALCRRTVSGV